MLSVYTRHHADCKNADAKAWRRCNCPEWICGTLDGNFIRRSTRTPNWDDAKELHPRLQKQVTTPALPAR